MLPMSVYDRMSLRLANLIGKSQLSYYHFVTDYGKGSGILAPMIIRNFIYTDHNLRIFERKESFDRGNVEVMWSDDLNIGFKKFYEYSRHISALSTTDPISWHYILVLVK